MNILEEIETVKMVEKEICCLICETFIERTMRVSDHKDNYKVCPECEKSVSLWKSI